MASPWSKRSTTSAGNDSNRKPLVRYVLWMFVETGVGDRQGTYAVNYKRSHDEKHTCNPQVRRADQLHPSGSGFYCAPLIYLVGNLRDAMGPFAYSVADFLYGPVWAASLVALVFPSVSALASARARMSLALLATVLAAGAMITVACIRSANRQYHLIHPELHLENSSTVLIVWTTLVAGVTGGGWHFLGWSLLLVGSAGWTSSQVPAD